MHISNRHLRLAPIVARLAASQRLVALQQIELTAPGWPEGKNESHWIVMARNPEDLGALTKDSRWSPLVASPSTPLWTDDFSNILSVLVRYKTISRSHFRVREPVTRGRRCEIPVLSCCDPLACHLRPNKEPPMRRGCR